VSKHPTITLKSTKTPIDGKMHLVYPQSIETRWVLQKPKKKSQK
jgi:long-subunit fatty acid transport protein